jgi:hypothetical protein
VGDLFEAVPVLHGRNQKTQRLVSSLPRLTQSAVPALAFLLRIAREMRVPQQALLQEFLR